LSGEGGGKKGRRQNVPITAGEGAKLGSGIIDKTEGKKGPASWGGGNRRGFRCKKGVPASSTKNGRLVSSAKKRKAEKGKKHRGERNGQQGKTPFTRNGKKKN